MSTHHATLSTHPSCAYKGTLARAADIAEHYGFKLIKPLDIDKEDRVHAERHMCSHEHAALVRMAAEDPGVRAGETLLLAHVHKVPYKNKAVLRLDVIGDKESSAEALLLQTTHAIIRDHGETNLFTTLNSMGGRESGAGFPAAITTFFRSRLADLHPECRDAIRASVFAPLRCTHGACAAVRADAPQPLSFLSEPSRRHFKEVLEYLENLKLPYGIDPWLVGNEHYTTRTVFAVGTPDTEEPSDTQEYRRPLSNVLAWGERYDHLSKRMGFKKPLPAIHASIDLGIQSASHTDKKATGTKAPHVYLVQVGLPAKIQALVMQEMLRKANISVSITLHKKGVTEQMEHAQTLGAPVLVIIGHREATTGTALVRHLPNNHQETVPFATLPAYLRDIYTTRKHH